jgi:hypothetical protein
MMQKEIISVTKNKALLIIIATVAACIILLSLFLHTKVIEVEKDFENFATHHYFLTGFIGLIIMVICIRFYNDTPDRVTSFNILKHNTRTKRNLRKYERIAQYKKQLGLKINTVKSQFIEKENVSSLSFPNYDVLISLDDIQQRKIDLETSLKLGNNYKHKVKIYFKDTTSNKHIETTVWQLDNNNLTIKSGTTLPVKCIYKIEI